jgi:hypothetical protein
MIGSVRISLHHSRSHEGTREPLIRIRSVIIILPLSSSLLPFSQYPQHIALRHAVVKILLVTVAKNHLLCVASANDQLSGRVKQAVWLW